jgi:hypothetical protein
MIAGNQPLFVNNPNAVDPNPKQSIAVADQA